MSQAARLQARQRFFNLVVTNVPGPQFPLYLLGRRLTALYPQVPLAQNQALGIAIMSYDGRLNFGLLGDYDAMPDLDAAGPATWGRRSTSSPSPPASPTAQGRRQTAARRSAGNGRARAGRACRAGAQPATALRAEARSRASP